MKDVLNPAKSLEVTLHPGEIVFVQQTGFLGFAYVLSGYQSDHYHGQLCSLWQEVLCEPAIRSIHLRLNRCGPATANCAADARAAPVSAPATRSRRSSAWTLGGASSCIADWLSRVAVLGIALAGAYFFKMWPVYEANSLVYVSPSPGKVLDGGAQPFAFDGASYQVYLQQQMVDVTRDDVLMGALHKLDPRLMAVQRRERSGRSGTFVAHHRSTIRTARINSPLPREPTNPDMAAKLANAVTNSYIESTSREQKSGDAERVSILQAERDRVQKELTADRSRARGPEQATGRGWSWELVLPILSTTILARTRAALVRRARTHDEAEAKFAAMDAGAGAASAAIDAQADEMAATDPGLTSMKTSLNQRRAAMLTQMANLTSNHPVYKQDAEELAKINSQPRFHDEGPARQGSRQIQQGPAHGSGATAGR